MGRSAQRPCIWTQYMPSGGAVVSWSCLSVRPGSLLAMDLLVRRISRAQSTARHTNRATRGCAFDSPEQEDKAASPALLKVYSGRGVSHECGKPPQPLAVLYPCLPACLDGWMDGG